ncbi:sister chromatid cohesion protein [Grosmannia clavigera kw1407]|uniref:Sister chromatid cohesion protein n=1 Tax=Grosmannia clavigera (strain kw1407 / UAMH 11150) TaxID=655863 RepID=F0XV08_GROCL|nr:sister chromatid cohesion protein [Grosmannia clavigera kw1407]EFW98936.1 sister chromatid cohesion protein [Grosmannia clavigera kw1407]
MASSATIHRRPPPAEAVVANPLPTILQTPAGLALLELQGTINLFGLNEGRVGDEDDDDSTTATVTPIGHLDFPDYNPGGDPADTAWMQRVHLRVGRFQRLTGEVKKLPRPIAVVQRSRPEGTDSTKTGDRLDVVEIVHYKLQFSQRPEPMTTSMHNS